MSLLHRTPLAIRTLLGLVVVLNTSALTAQSSPAPLRRASVDTSRSAAPSGTIDGVVTDTNLVPLRGAFVSILSSRIRVGTGPNGRFRITSVPAGQYLVVVKRAGYHPTSAVVDVVAGDTLRLSYTLTDAPATTLDPVVVSEKAVSFRMAEFEQRRRLGIGQFMTQTQIDQHNTTYATELMRRFTSVNVSPSHTSVLTEYFALSNREGGNPTLGACPMTVYLDQVPLPTPFNLDLLPTPKDLAGIEVYSGSSTIPAQFNGMNHGCGVILVWTRDGS
jgi:Carboxypeptidase regulatory-like domain